MRLSDAILLGSSIVKPQGGAEKYPDGSGCARGMALEAVNCRKNPERTLFTGIEFPKVYAEFMSCQFEYIWPWTKRTVLKNICSCGREDSVSEIIMHLFDYHIMNLKDWTLEQLVDWVRSVEPPEPDTVESEIKAEETREVEKVMSEI